MREIYARLPRFYCGGELSTGKACELSVEAAQHARVLRLASGDAVTLFNGRGGEFEARFTSLTRSRATLAVGVWHGIERESPLAVTLVQAVSSGEKMDLTVQKATELGAAAIQPVLTGKSIVRLSAARAMAKLAHWQRVAIAACEQCGRNRIPEIRTPLALAEYCRAPGEAALRLMLTPQAQRALVEAALAPAGPLTLAAGPEAGFSAADEALLAGAGFLAVRLGPRVLRTETAALAALAALNALAGER